MFPKFFKTRPMPLKPINLGDGTGTMFPTRGPRGIEFRFEIDRAFANLSARCAAAEGLTLREFVLREAKAAAPKVPIWKDPEILEAFVAGVQRAAEKTDL